MKIRKMKVTGIQCPVCQEKLWSKYRHDFHYCECQYCFIDGGQEDYIRFGYGLNSADWHANDWEVPEIIKFMVPYEQLYRSSWL